MGDISGTGVQTLHPLPVTVDEQGTTMRTTNHASVDDDHHHYNNNTIHADLASKADITTTVHSNNNNNCNTLPVPTRQRKGGSGRRSECGRDKPLQQNPTQHGDFKTTTTTTTTPTTTTYLPQMSVEARHAISETLKEMETEEEGEEKVQEEEGEEKVEKGEGEETGWRRLQDVVNEEDDVFVHDDDNNDNSISSLPSIADPLPSLPLQRRSWQPSETLTCSTQQQQQSRENSLTFSHKTATTATRHNSYRSGRNTDGGGGSSLVKGGGRTPRRSTKRHFGVNGRSLPGPGRAAPAYSDQPSRVDLNLLNDTALSSSPAEVRHHETVHLPAITSRTEPHVTMAGAAAVRKEHHVRHVNYRIRGVGSYRVARENTFEITGPGFDVRYRDVITCQTGDRDSPPPEIFQQSVGKVQEWLNKHYSPYSPS